MQDLLPGDRGGDAGLHDVDQPHCGVVTHRQVCQGVINLIKALILLNFRVGDYCPKAWCYKLFSNIVNLANSPEPGGCKLGKVT